MNNNRPDLSAIMYTVVRTEIYVKGSIQLQNESLPKPNDQSPLKYCNKMIQPFPGGNQVL